MGCVVFGGVGGGMICGIVGTVGVTCWLLLVTAGSVLLGCGDLFGFNVGFALWLVWRVV